MCPAALEVFVDVNNSVFIPSSYSLYTYTVTAVTVSNLTATGLDAGTPTAGTPALTQTHVLTASGLDAGPTYAEQPVFSAVFPNVSFAATVLGTSAPVLASPGLT